MLIYGISGFFISQKQKASSSSGWDVSDALLMVGFSMTFFLDKRFPATL